MMRRWLVASLVAVFAASLLDTAQCLLVMRGEGAASRSRSGSSSGGGGVMSRRSFWATATATAVTTPYFFFSQHAVAADGGGLSMRDALKSIERVRDSCKQISNDVENGTGGGDLQRQIRMVVKNYRLEDALVAAKRQAPKSNRERAGELGRDALEYFEQMKTYFPEKIDNMTGARMNVMDSSRTQFIIDALAASSQKLLEFESTLEADEDLAIVRKEIADELS